MLCGRKKWIAQNTFNQGIHLNAQMPRKRVNLADKQTFDKSLGGLRVYDAFTLLDELH